MHILALIGLVVVVGACMYLAEAEWTSAGKEKHRSINCRNCGHEMDEDYPGDNCFECGTELSPAQKEWMRYQRKRKNVVMTRKSITTLAGGAIWFLSSAYCVSRIEHRVL